MLSLLPQQLKKEVEKAYHTRLFVVAGFLFAAVGILASVVLVPYIALSNVKENAVEIGVAAQEKENAETPLEDYSNEVKETKLLLATFAKPTETIRAEMVVERLIRAKPSEVTLSGIALARTGSSSAQVIVEGVAQDRDALLFFVQELKKVPLLRSVVLPVSNFAKAEDIDFSLTLISSY